MNPSFAYESLAGVRPGATRVSEVVTRFGPATTNDASDGGQFFRFEACGVHVLVEKVHRCDPDPVVSEVRLTSPFLEALPCGVRLGQKKAEALQVLRRAYQVVYEYDDSIYFRPSAWNDLVASVEFFDQDEVVSFELINWIVDEWPPNWRNRK